MKQSKIQNRVKFLVIVAMTIILTLAYQFLLYPKLLQPVGAVYELKDINWHPQFKPECNQDHCSIQSTDEPARAVSWIKSQNSGLFLLNYSIEIIPIDDKGNKHSVDGRVALFPESDGKLRWDVPHLLVKKLVYDHWQGTSKLHFDIPTQRMQLAIELHEPNSKLTLHSLRLAESKETPLQKTIFVMFAVVWMIIFFIALRWLIGNSLKSNLPLVLVFLAIAIGTQVPNSWFSSVKDILTIYAPLEPEQYAQKTIMHTETESRTEAVGTSRLNLVKKAAHGFLFAAFAFLLWHRAKYKNRLFWIPLYVLLVAAATETTQALGTTRTASFRDFGIDAFGLTLGLLLTQLKENFARVVSRPKDG